MRIVLIGSGNVAHYLATNLAKQECNICQNYSRNISNAKGLASQLKGTQPIDDLKNITPTADLYIIAVKDDAISEVANQLPSLPNAIIVHTSGSKPMELLSKFKNHGVFYPLQTFKKNTNLVFKDFPILLEGNHKIITSTLSSVAQKLSSNIQVMRSEERKKLHLAAVVSSNFTNFILTLAEDYCKQENVAFNLLVPLIQETCSKIEHSSPSRNQTGPAVRKDEITIQDHLEMLQSNKELQRVYQFISEGIMHYKP